MNQILQTKKNYSQNFIPQTTKNRNCKFYKVQLVVSCFIAFCFIIFFLIRLFSLNQNEKISSQLISIYNASTLYSNSMNYSTQSNSETKNIPIENYNPFVIGIIKIDKINLNYPILSESNDDLLDISVCRFAGPMPNEVGNLCIAGHNYVDYKFFSRLHELEIDDKIKLYDLSGRMLEYSIFKKYEVDVTDMSCTSQNTNQKNIITLLTCNNVSGKRLVVVAEPI